MAHDPSNSAGGSRDCGAFFLDVVGCYARDHVRVEWTDRGRPTNPQIEQIIEETWASQTQHADQTQRLLYNGRLCRLIEYSADNDRMTLTLGPVSFKEFLGTNGTHAHLRYLHGPDILADPLGVSAAVVTRDQFILLGRRSRQVALYAGRVHPIGGIVEPPAEACPVDPFRTLIEEVAEETGISPEQTAPPCCLGLIRDKHTVQPELIFELEVHCDMPSIRAQSAGARDAEEHSEWVPIRNHPAAVVTFIEHHFTDLTPVALATLLLHGLYRWGSGWFAAARGYLRSVI